MGSVVRMGGADVAGRLEVHGPGLDPLSGQHGDTVVTN